MSPPAPSFASSQLTTRLTSSASVLAGQAVLVVGVALVGQPLLELAELAHPEAFHDSPSQCPNQRFGVASHVRRELRDPVDERGRDGGAPLEHAPIHGPAPAPTPQIDPRAHDSAPAAQPALQLLAGQGVDARLLPGPIAVTFAARRLSAAA